MGSLLTTMIFQSWQWLKSQWSALSAQLGELPHVYGHTNFPKQFIIQTFHPAGWPAPSQTKKGPAEAWEQALFVKTKEKKNQIKSNLSLLYIMLQHCSPHLSMHPHFLCMCTILVTEDNYVFFTFTLYTAELCGKQVLQKCSSVQKPPLV